MLRAATTASVDRIGRELARGAWPLVGSQVAARLARMSDAEIERAVRVVIAEADKLRGLLR